MHHQRRAATAATAAEVEAGVDPDTDAGSDSDVNIERTENSVRSMSAVVIELRPSSRRTSRSSRAVIPGVHATSSERRTRVTTAPDG